MGWCNTRSLVGVYPGGVPAPYYLMDSPSLLGARLGGLPPFLQGASLGQLPL